MSRIEGSLDRIVGLLERISAKLATPESKPIDADVHLDRAEDRQRSDEQTELLRQIAENTGGESQ